MRLSAAVAALLVAVAAAAETELSGENQTKLSRRHLLYPHRLFLSKLRLDNRNNDSDDSSSRHKKKSKMGNNWHELDEVHSLGDVETTETRGDEVQANVSEDVTATGETTSYSTEEDCKEAIRRHLSKQDKAGKDSKVKSGITDFQNFDSF